MRANEEVKIQFGEAKIIIDHLESSQRPPGLVFSCLTL